jgi:hypothetical protein
MRGWGLTLTSSRLWADRKKILLRVFRKFVLSDTCSPRSPDRITNFETTSIWEVCISWMQLIGKNDAPMRVGGRYSLHNRNVRREACSGG